MGFDLTKPGAKAERAKLKEFHRILNHPAIVPEQAYRMAKRHWPLVCYINNIVGPFLSNNYEVIPIFIVRANEFMAQVPSTPASAAYYDLLAKYLRQVAHVLSTYTDTSREQLARIPEEILNAGPQDAPEVFPHDT